MSAEPTSHGDIANNSIVDAKPAAKHANANLAYQAPVRLIEEPRGISFTANRWACCRVPDPVHQDELEELDAGDCATVAA